MASKTARGTRSEQWQGLIAEQERNGQSIRVFSEERGIGEQAFYLWRRRLQKQKPVRFALVEAGGNGQPAAAGPLELILTTGERLRIGAGADGAMLRTVLEALRR